VYEDKEQSYIPVLSIENLQPYHLLAIFFLIQPLILLRFITAQFTVGKLIFLYIIVAILLLFWVTRWQKQLEIGKDIVALLIGLFLLSSFISAVLAPNPAFAFLGRYQRFEGWLTFLSLAVLFMIARNVGWQKAITLSLAVAIPTAITSAYGILQRLGLDFLTWEADIFENWRAFSTNGNPVSLGGFLVFALPISLGAALLCQRKWQKIAGFSAFVLGSLCLYATNSQGAWFGAVLSMVVLSYFVGVIKNHKWLKVASALVVLAIIIFVTVLFIQRSSLIFEGANQTRLLIYNVAWRAFLAKPIFGWGFDNFHLAIQRFVDSSYTSAMPPDMITDKAHNVFLEMLVTTGIVGALLYFFLIAFSMYQGFKNLQRYPYPDNHIVALWISGAVGYFAYMATGITDLVGLPLFWITLGFLVGPPARDIALRPGLIRAQLTASPAILTACVLVFIGISTFAADRSFYVAERLPLPYAEQYYRQAELLSPFNYDYLIEHGPRLVVEGVGTGDRQLWEAGVNIIERAVALNKTFGEAHVNLALAYKYGAERFGLDLYSKAVKSLNDALSVYPLYYEAHRRLALTYQSMGEYEKSICHADFGIKLRPKDISCFQIKASSLFKQGRLQEAQVVLLKARDINPSNKAILDDLAFISNKLKQ